jgi:hypothetical protein
MALRITIDIFSGRPNPVVTVTGPEERELLERLGLSRKGSAAARRGKAPPLPQSTLWLSWTGHRTDRIVQAIAGSRDGVAFPISRGERIRAWPARRNTHARSVIRRIRLRLNRTIPGRRTRQAFLRHLRGGDRAFPRDCGEMALEALALAAETFMRLRTTVGAAVVER